MDATGILKLRRNAAAGDDAVSDGETDGEDSYFDLVFRSPDRVAVGRGGEAVEKDYRFVGSPKAVFQSGNGASNSKAPSPVTPLRSTPRFKVLFAFSFRKPNKGEKTLSACDLSTRSGKIDGSGRFTAGCGVEGPATGDNSLRSQLLRDASDCETSPVKMPSRDAVPKYLRYIKPLYLKVWKKQNEKARSPDSLTPSSPPRMFPDGSGSGSCKIRTKRLRKSRSASARPRDDPVLEQQHDGIQGAVLYCKRSYNSSSRETSEGSDSWHKKLVHEGRHSCEGPILRCSI